MILNVRIDYKYRPQSRSKIFIIY